MTAPATRRPALAGAALLAGLVVAAVLVFSSGSAPSTASTIRPLRVTSGPEVATGFGVGGDRVVTVAHALGGAVRVGGVPARVVRVDRRADLALLRVAGVAGAEPGESGAGDGEEAGDGEGAGGGEEADAGVGERAGDGEEAGAGDEVRVLRLRSGRSDSLSGRVRRAIVARVRALGAGRAVTRPALEVDARVAPGDSGAPVVSRSGALVGVVFATSARREGRAYAVDASAVRRLIARD